MKQHILFVLHLPPPVHGAAMVGQYIHDSKLINETFDCKYINLTMAGSIVNVGKFSLSKIKSLFIILKQIRRELRYSEYKFVYVTPNAGGNAFFKDYIVVQYIKYLGGNVVMHFHNKGVEKNSQGRFKNYLYKRYFKNAKVILLSKSLYPDFKKYVKEKDLSLCANGIPDVTFRTSKNNDKCRILFLSNLIISKGVLDLLDACEILSKKHIEYECVFVGAETKDMDEERFNREVQARSLQKFVKYCGKKMGKDKDLEFDNADIFVFPSYNECFPLVLLEAMRHALPCISTVEGAIPDIVDDGKTGLLVGKQNPFDLADKMSLLIGNADMRIKMGKMGRMKYEERYTLEQFEGKMVGILKDI